MIEYHRELLADEKRTLAYREAIRQTVKPGDVVVDLGAGSGILSFLACEAGAAHVYAIDSGHMADVVTYLARHLGLSDRVTVFHELSTKVELPRRADVLVTETMGSLGYDEQMLGYILDARKRLLREGAAIVPRSVALHILPVELPEIYKRHIDFWREPLYGFDLSPMRFFASNSLGYVQLDPAAGIAAEAQLIDVDFATHETTLVSGRTTFVAERDATVHGFGAWFTTTLAEGVSFSTREPRATHWAQVFLPLEVPLTVVRGGEIRLELETDDGKVWRWRGTVAEAEFDQMTRFAAPPCVIG
ncbi:MAG TPA: 50S ribosomal protein L11 methyltransferase [Thermoanaerobaculia bacterium]|nr:50S ribosomal protein L11 methyltransferase [Thermoanaerobaculia bacterium]